MLRNKSLVPLSRQHQHALALCVRIDRASPIELMVEHATLRKEFAQAEVHALSAKNLLAFAKSLSSHIRKEERQLFERMQELLQPEELGALGASLEIALKGTVDTCILPTPATLLRANK